MSDSHTPARRRYRLIEAVLDDVRRSGRPAVPAALRDEVDAHADRPTLVAAHNRLRHDVIAAMGPARPEGGLR